MAIVQELANSTNAATQTTLTVAITSVKAGNTIAVFVKSEGVNTTYTVTDGIGNTLTPKTKRGNPPTTSWGQWHYYTAPSSGNFTYTNTMSPASDFPSIFVYELSGVAFDTETTGNGTSTSFTSGNFTTTAGGTALCGYAEISSAAVSSETINSIAADRIDTPPAPLATLVWTLNYSAGFTGAAAATCSLSKDYALCVLAFQNVVDPGSSTTGSRFGWSPIRKPLRGRLLRPTRVTPPSGIEHREHER